MGFVGRRQETGLLWETSLQEATGKMKLGSPAQLSHGSSYPHSFYHRDLASVFTTTGATDLA